jgi:hypothetical protein
MLIRKAAKETAAGPGNFYGIQGKVLILGHFYRYRFEFIRDRVAAITAAANPQAPGYPGFIPHPYLAQFYSGFEDPYQVFDKISKIYPVFRGKKEKDLGLFQKKMD